MFRWDFISTSIARNNPIWKYSFDCINQLFNHALFYRWCVVCEMRGHQLLHRRRNGTTLWSLWQRHRYHLSEHTQCHRALVWRSDELCCLHTGMGKFVYACGYWSVSTLWLLFRWCIQVVGMWLLVGTLYVGIRQQSIWLINQWCSIDQSIMRWYRWCVVCETARLPILHGE